MADLGPEPTNLIDLVAIGKLLLITRGPLYHFYDSHDVAKYFVVILWH